MTTTTTDSTRTADYNTIHALQCQLRDEDTEARNEFDSARSSLVQYITPGRVDWAATRKAEIADLERRLDDACKRKARMKKAEDDRLDAGALLALMQALDHLYAAWRAGGAVTEDHVEAVEGAVYDAGGWPSRSDAHSLSGQGYRLSLAEVKELASIQAMETRATEQEREVRRGLRARQE